MVEVSPVRTDVPPVCDLREVEPCGVFTSQPVLKTMQHLLQLN